MKKIINGNKYNTDTAKRLGNWSNSSNYRDLNYCSETLYRIKSGRYFLHGEGGPASRYSKSTGNNNWSGSEEIEPMTREAAQEWAEEHLDGDEYEEIFGEVEEGDGREQLCITISIALKAKLWTMAEKSGMSMSALIEEELERLIK